MEKITPAKGESKKKRQWVTDILSHFHLWHRPSRPLFVSELNAVILGSKGSYKYLVGNIILGTIAFDAADATFDAERRAGEVCGESVTLVNAPRVAARICTLWYARTCPERFLTVVFSHKPKAEDTDGRAWCFLGRVPLGTGFWELKCFSLVTGPWKSESKLARWLEERSSSFTEEQRRFVIYITKAINIKIPQKGYKRPSRQPIVRHVERSIRSRVMKIWKCVLESSRGPWTHQQAQQKGLGRVWITSGEARRSLCFIRMNINPELNPPHLCIHRDTDNDMNMHTLVSSDVVSDSTVASV